MEVTMRDRNQWAIAALLAGLLVGASWFCVSVWRSTPMPLYGNVILTGAVILILILGCGLIALMFYSHRKGYDEPARSNWTQRE
ncbi:hypothetical protein I6F16_22955 [Bradyrhizobium sp. IC4060]|nr:hypothetical protein [Bradyrhizobium sp. IC4060]MCA1484212.1 hypothetical protein [Bradyrhizobium sp. IC4061]MCA1539812.1 hypothetical protein [Bradyrhizobium sp. NBAIM32]